MYRCCPHLAVPCVCVCAGKGCKIRDSIIMGLDYYEKEKSFVRAVSRSFPAMGIGAGTSIRKVRCGGGCIVEGVDLALRYIHIIFIPSYYVHVCLTCQ